jgi:hypothetical protein
MGARPLLNRLGDTPMIRAEMRNIADLLTTPRDRINLDRVTRVNG